MNTYGWKQITMAKSMKKAKAFKHRQRKGYNTRVLDEKRKGKKPMIDRPVRCHRCQDVGHYAFSCTRKYSHDLLVKGTEVGTWNEIWYVNASYNWHVTGNEDLFVRFKNNLSDIFLHGVGDVKIFLNGKMRDISCVSYVSKLNKNVLSVEQLMHQGYEVLKDGDKCLVKGMFESLHELDDPINIITKESFMLFMDSLKNQNYVMRFKEELKEHFPRIVKWFFDVHLKQPNGKVYPPTLPNGNEVDLLDLYLYVDHEGGYVNASKNNKWSDIAHKLGFQEDLGPNLRMIYSSYLELLAWIYKNQKAKDGEAYKDQSASLKEEAKVE